MNVIHYIYTRRNKMGVTITRYIVLSEEIYDDIHRETNGKEIWRASNYLCIISNGK